MHVRQRIGHYTGQLLSQLAARLDYRPVHRRLTGVAAGALVLAMAGSVILAPSAALAAPKTPPPTAPKPFEIGTVNPTAGHPDLRPFMYISNTTVGVGVPFYYSITVQNNGDGTAGPSRTNSVVHQDFTDVQIMHQSPGTSCLIQYGTGAPGYHVICNHGSIGPGGSAVVRIQATPRQGALYGFPTGVDVTNAVAESNEGNNSANIQLSVPRRVP